ncbi:hypothetical protein AAFF_G00176360 [Aldrovandia affinis]|uniref:Uncharacterized protein n=1 Tax=Aldrovandia affinis TaxID=143900 RepID=A0AAD7W7E5_9TELE|nr:hypothetical protein AAFF_G00176360 [Aldrovandia affinis]
MGKQRQPCHSHDAETYTTNLRAKRSTLQMSCVNPHLPGSASAWLLPAAPPRQLRSPPDSPIIGGEPYPALSQLCFHVWGCSEEVTCDIDTCLFCVSG